MNIKSIAKYTEQDSGELVLKNKDGVESDQGKLYTEPSFPPEAPQSSFGET